jgi:GNAT superfamily N-acetyltransferase
MNIEIHHFDRAELLPLFSSADDSPMQIAGYIDAGVILVAREGDTIIGYVQIIETREESLFEIKSMAVTEGWQRSGVGTALVSAVAALCREWGGQRLTVSTSTADTGNLRFYLRLGFRFFRIVTDAFGPSSGYAKDAVVDGIPLRDQIFLELALGDPGA